MRVVAVVTQCARAVWMRPRSRTLLGTAGRPTFPAMTGIVATSLLIGLAACTESGGAAPPSATKTRLAPVATPARGPNVVLITLDTTRADRCSFLGYERSTTPYLERLAQESVVYVECWSPSPWTGPSHAALFTGLRPENSGFLGRVRRYLSASEQTLAEQFGAAGYATLGISNNPNVSLHNGLNQGFETWHEQWTMGAAPVARVTTAGTAPLLPATFKAANYGSAAESHELALAWIRERRSEGRPFFAFINEMEPHGPYVPDDDLQKRFVAPGTDPVDIEWGRAFRYPVYIGHCLGVFAVKPHRLRVLSDLYDAEIATLDRQIERFVEALRRDGTLDNTILVIVGDHGEHLGEHGLLNHVMSVRRELLHVPLLIRAPSHLAASVVSDLVRVEDVAPTLLEVCGLLTTGDIDGASLLASTEGRESHAALDRMSREQIAEARALFPTADVRPMEANWRSYTDGVVHYFRDDAGNEHLFDLTSDPGEDHNRVDEGGEQLEHARARSQRVHPVR